MPKSFSLGNFTIHWLQGGEFELDGGCMFGVVPKVLWQQKFPAHSDGYASLTASPILIQTPEANVVIESGLGNKLTDKQKKIFRLTKEWDIPSELKKIGLHREEIDHVILTHYDFDHSAGIVMFNDSGKTELTFPKATHHIQRSEWEDVLTPNIRSINTYWPLNFEELQKSGILNLVEGDGQVVDGIRLEHTGGHTRGHQIVWLESGNAKAVHLGDLLPNHAYTNPLWITPYDNFPLDSVIRKEQLMQKATSEERWFLFYHDPFMVACRFDEEGNIRNSINTAPC